MKKMMLGLVMVVMMFAMVGCGTEDKNDTPPTEQTNSTEDKNNTSSTEQITNSEEVKVVVDGLTGEKVTIVEEKTEVEEIPVVESVVIFAEAKEVILDTVSDYVVFEYLKEDGKMCYFSNLYSVGTFKVGDVVKFTFEKKDGLIDYSNPDSWEIVEE